MSLQPLVVAAMQYVEALQGRDASVDDAKALLQALVMEPNIAVALAGLGPHYAERCPAYVVVRHFAGAGVPPMASRGHCTKPANHDGNHITADLFEFSERHAEAARQVRPTPPG